MLSGGHTQKSEMRAHRKQHGIIIIITPSYIRIINNIQKNNNIPGREKIGRRCRNACVCVYERLINNNI